MFPPDPAQGSSPLPAMGLDCKPEVVFIGLVGNCVGPPVSSDAGGIKF